MTRVHVAAVTCRGLVREHNEDRVGVLGWLAPVEMSAPVVLACRDPAAALVVVADGLGGHRAGEVASRHVVTRLTAALPEPADGESLARAFVDAHEELLELGRRDPELEGTATTATALLVRPDRSYLCHVGDSRAYYAEPGLVMPLTVDDVDEDAAGALTQVLGGVQGRRVDPHVRVVEPAARQRFLLCTDGLHSYVDEDVLKDAVVLDSAHDAAEALLAAAIAAGAPDNVSLCVVDVWREGENDD
ncbi:PP2C family protein-serine/threonine phosphatase [Lentzea chajnantorensis]